MTESPPAPPVRHRPVRWTGAIILLVIAALLVPATLVARFARGELLDTDRFVSTVTPLATDPQIQAALANRITDEIVSAVNLPAVVNQAVSALSSTSVGSKIDQLLGQLPQGGARITDKLNGLIAGPVEDWLVNFVHTHVAEFLASPKFPPLWAAIVRLAHTNIDAVLTGQQGTALTANGDAIQLNLQPVLAAVRTQLVDAGFGLAAQIPDRDVSYTLVETDQLPKIQKYVKLLNTLAGWLPWITLALFALAMWLAPNRRRAAVGTMALTVVLLVIVLVGNHAARRTLGSQLTSRGLDVNAGLALYDTVVRYLIAATVTTLVAAAIALVWLVLAGVPWVRRQIDRFAGGRAAALGWRRSGALGFLDRYRGWIASLLGIGALAILLHYPYVSTVIWLFVVALILAAACAVLHRLHRPPAVTAG